MRIRATTDTVTDLEHVAHRRRVEELCRLTTRCLNMEGRASLTLLRAADEHRGGGGRIRRSEPACVAANPDASDAAPESAVPQLLESIWPRQCKSDRLCDRGLEFANRIIEACDELDEAVEFAALNGISIPAAIEGFFDDAQDRLEPCIVNALRQTTSPRVLPVLIDDLPVLPSAAAKLIRTSDEGSTAIELERIVASDPVLTGRLLGAANSAYFGSRSEIGDLRQAIMRVGVPFARKVLLAACFGRVFASGALSGLWTHSKTVAVHAYELAAECGYDQSVAYIAGMLHDVGRLVTQRCPAVTRAEEDSLRSAGFPLVYAESLIYGTDHAALGGRLLKKWNLPFEIVEAVAFHHCPERSDSVLAGLLNLAEDDSLADTSPSEDLWRGMRRAASAQLTGIHGVSRHGTKRLSAVWSLAG